MHSAMPQHALVDEIERLREENKMLKEALMDAIDWNWLDEDRPEDLYTKYYVMAEQ